MSKFTYHELYKKLKGLKTINAFPNEFELPRVIDFNSDFWNTAVRAYKHTRADDHERAFMVFFADGELVTTELMRGGKTYVQSKTDVSVVYNSSHKPEYYERVVTVGGKTYSKRLVYYKDAPKIVEVMYLFNVHTHPMSSEGVKQSSTPNSTDGTNTYTFSVTDINSFYNSGAVMTGLITNELWLLFRTKESKMPISNLTDAQLTVEFITRELKYVMFKGRLKGRVVKVE
ncbi:hypothetical protein JW962_03030 [Candidatus Dojkabacteria bacterium]|nr:hypothetical protein [Candidatus Dojkabacteria bacterium]